MPALSSKQLLDLQLHPAPVRIYKPSHKDLSGTALELDLRLEPEVDAEKGYIKSVSGGLFLSLVAQKTRKSAEADATFDWGNEGTSVRAKLGITDISALLVAMRCYWHRRPIPSALRKKGDETGSVLSLFHRFEGGEGASSTVIEYTLRKEGAYLNMSKSATQRHRITLETHEILQLEARLEEALRAFQLVGKR